MSDSQAELGRAPTRRQFLKISGVAAAAAAAGAAGLPLFHFRRSARAAPTEADASRTTEKLGSWEDLYRQRWTWDSVTKGSHGWANCRSMCAWDIFVKDGIVVREEQSASYEASEPGVPDFNPRGCQKGACYTEVMYGPSRLTVPLKRVGERGIGKWKRISWDDALDTIATAIIDATEQHGPETVVYDQGTTNIDFGPGTAAELRLVNILRSAHVEGWAGVGDMPMGCVQTWGMFNCEGTSDDWFNSDCIVVWSGNPVYTRIPEMHFMTEARYRGAKLIVIAPDLNATAIHADLWMNPRVESDPALGLAMAQIIIAEGLLDYDYVREQTGLPFLVRKDDERFLRESHVVVGGRSDAFYMWDEARGAAVLAPGSQGMRCRRVAYM